ncbi:protein canopy homolog 4 [Drosophila sulfurigaster albostrigata]|uniref:protein canopy homolog 4 n=1 Tax=Drosophila sulfurigaster albostrigata TaxID=89887 RepID=UPI002D21C16D|nr:protein canopy homolog 4 [Drosophila sulfurigaster albostrigata]
MLRPLFIFSLVALIHLKATYGQQTAEEEQGVRYANRCEACKILAAELEARLGETGKSHDVIEIGYSVDDVRPKKRTEYRRSELRLLESLENVCERVLEYNLHKERTDSTRFAKGMSQTFQTLHGLVDKGVKVDLGIPYELWDKPPVEVTQMKTQCENMLEQYEDEISDWYFKLQETKSLQKHLCEEHVLKHRQERECLKEQLPEPKPEKKDKKAKGEKQKKTKGEKEEL